MSPQRRLLLKSRWCVVHLRFSRLPDIRSVVSWNTFGALGYQRIARSPCRISFVLDSISCGSRADSSSRTGRAVSRLLDSETVRDQAEPLAAYRSVRTPAPTTSLWVRSYRRVPSVSHAKRTRPRALRESTRPGYQSFYRCIGRGLENKVARRIVKLPRQTVARDIGENGR
jgi:hypothetical protein